MGLKVVDTTAALEEQKTAIRINKRSVLSSTRTKVYAVNLNLVEK